MCQIPCVFDFHHYYCWQQPQKSIMDLMPSIIDTWHGRKLIMHLSEQDPLRQTGAHSEYIETIPPELFETIIKYDVNIDLEIEAKMKEQAVFRLYQKYHFIDNNRPKLKIAFKKK